ncbi:MAG: ABC transporter ATP-binding protein/permease [Firmicutes bacterium]|uniref:Multidrug ABC transporter ATP-binding protein n=1 Tax=Sulfobacillus benefaciens TaxID=453960 RepID=A0A2T2WY01_9FIRM|nr:ABC transporter ATP-binding protein/permease [Bacillota bacterium]MCL5015328.1 ABC transporter ATP-binding protein/permease [Bacillota bacterium]PSR27111.1 MAG: multidrug ABC transporter ATP-binding protein [Sulfobacillus benefaciens]
MKQLLSVLRPSWLPVSLVIVLTFLQSLSTLYLPRLMADIVDNGVIKSDIHYIFVMGGVMLGVTVLGVGFSVAAGYLASKVAAEFGRVIRNNIFRHVESFMPHEFDQIGTSSLIVRSTNDVMQVQQFVNMLLRMMVTAPLMALGGIIMAVSTNAQLSSVLVIILPLLAVSVYIILKRGTVLFQWMQSSVDVLNRVVRETLTGIRIIRTFGRDDYEEARFQDANSRLTDVSIEVNTLMALLLPLVMLIINLSIIAILWYGGKEVGAHTLAIGNLMAFIQYITQIMFSTMMVSAMFFMIPRAQASATRINDIFHFSPQVRDKENALQEPGSSLSWPPLRFDDVSFQYPGASTPVLSHLSFDIPRGKVTAVIGGTGAGKTTLLNLIPRFFDATDGQILLDGVDVRDLSQKAVRSRIAYVPQRAVVFSGTIADNIRFGNPDASAADVKVAAGIAQAAEFISQLPNEWDFVVNQDGTNLSGGQKQRLAIARALVKPAEIYLFDDSFSALDYQTDRNLRDALRKSLKDAAIILVSQRVHTVMDADHILVLDEGRLAGLGTHEELMNRCPVYQEIVRTQLSKEVSA